MLVFHRQKEAFARREIGITEWQLAQSIREILL